MRRYINFNSYSVSRAEKRELIDTLDSGWITTGPKTALFEEKFADYVGVKYSAGLSSGTAALHLALLALGIGTGDEVITTPMTFVATVNAVLYTGANPVLADVEPDTLNIDPGQIKKKIGSRTKAIIPVHYAGQPCNMNAIAGIAKKNGLFIVEDAAHAIEAEYGGKKIASMGDIACYSFHAIKNITTGEGGMVATNSKKLADKVKILRLHGLEKEAWSRYGKRFKQYNVHCLGYKYNMTDMQAALGIQQLSKIDMFWAKRKKYAAVYDFEFEGAENIIRLPNRPDEKNAYHLYPIRVKTENLSLSRDQIMDKISKNNIGVSVHFKCVNSMDFYKKLFNCRPGAFPNAEYASERLISLPLYPKMSEGDVLYVAKTVKKIVSNARKQ